MIVKKREYKSGQRAEVAAVVDVGDGDKRRDVFDGKTVQGSFPRSLIVASQRGEQSSQHRAEQGTANDDDNAGAKQ